jgi:hypothetical protein
LKYRISHAFVSFPSGAARQDFSARVDYGFDPSDHFRLSFRALGHAVTLSLTHGNQLWPLRRFRPPVFTGLQGPKRSILWIFFSTWQDQHNPVFG